MSLNYTLVAHSGLTNHVEMRSVTTKAEQERVISAGGVIFTSFTAADNAEYEANYHEIKDSNSIIGNAKLNGHFSKKKVKGSKIFIPTTVFKKLLVKKELLKS